MGKEYVNQHIVPKRYLDRFASQINGKNMIGTRVYIQNKPKLFTQVTSKVGYIKNYYDVTDKDDPKYWEHYFATEIDTLCGTEMEHIINAATLFQNGREVLTQHNKEVLSKIIVAQLMRVPSSVDYTKTIYPRIEKEVKDRARSVIPASLLSTYTQKINDCKLNEQEQKELFLNSSFNSEHFDKYCSLLQERIWVVYINTQRKCMPFVTSDNPVLVEGIGKKEIGLFKNGLSNPATCIFFPITPGIAVASYSKFGIVGVAADDLDGKRILIDELGFIMDKNIKIMDQAYQHSFIPQPFYDEIMNDRT